MANMQKINDSLKNLEDLGIFQLRQLAREIGVHLPTTMRKTELIAEIRAIASGKTRPFVSTCKKGRPPKPFQNVQEHETEGGPYDFMEWGKRITPIVDTPMSLIHMSDNSSFVFDERKYASVLEFSGIVSIDEAGNGRIHEGNLNQMGEGRIARVEFPVINKFDLRDGDYVEGRIGESLKDGTFSLFNVFSINSNPVPLNRVDFSQAKAIPVCNKIDINIALTRYITPIGQGQRVLVESKDGTIPKRFMHEMAQDLSKKSKVIYVALDEQPENFLSLDNDNLEYVLCPFDLPVDKQLYTLELATSHAKRLAEQGQHVCLFVEDLFIAARLYSRCFKSFYQTDSSEFVLDNMKKLLATGRNIQDAGSVTFVAGITNNFDFPTSKDLMFEIKKACNSFITFNTGVYFGVYDYDIKACFSETQEKLLDQQSLKKAYLIRQEALNKNAAEIDDILNK